MTKFVNLKIDYGCQADWSGTVFLIKTEGVYVLDVAYMRLWIC